MQRKILYFAIVLGHSNVAFAQSGSCKPATDMISGQTYNGVYMEKQMSDTIVADFAKCLYPITDVFKTWLDADE